MFQVTTFENDFDLQGRKEKFKFSSIMPICDAPKCQGYGYHLLHLLVSLRTLPIKKSGNFWILF